MGFNVQADSTRSALLVISALLLCGQFLLARFVVDSRFGKILIAVRDTESRTRFLGYRPESYKLVVWVLSAVMAGIGGALYVPQVGHHQSKRVRAGQFDRGGDLGGGRRPRHLGGRDPGRDPGEFRQDLVHRRAAGNLALCAWARCSSSSRCSCRAASWACSGPRTAKEPEPEPPAVAAAHEVTG